MPSFRVKAVYDYTSPHEDDLNFPAGQIITVTEEEDADWYVGEYVDESGTKKDGLFPKNFVEKYEPEPPPRPNRASRHKPLESPVIEIPPPTPQVQQQEVSPIQTEESENNKPRVAPVDTTSVQPSLSPTSPLSTTSARGSEAPQQQQQSQAPKPAPPPAATTEKKAPPPVSAKPSSFRDRIAAFNQASAAPITPFKPGGGPPSTFIKKPFVAPPPSRNAYVPPPREAPQVKTYRREEDPEIAERQAQEQENAERAGLASATASATEGEEEQPKPTSLKERIALLQKQQAEQAQRAAALHKEKPKKPPPPKRSDSHDQRESGEGSTLEKVMSSEPKERASTDSARPPPARRPSHAVKSPEAAQAHRELLSENDADQSGAGDTEEAEGSTTSVEDDEDQSKHHRAAAPAAVPAAKDKDDEQEVSAEEEEEEDEMDAETRRKLELRERMAKMSGGMGLAGMFGAPGGMPMGGLPPKKKKSAPEHKDSESNADYSVPQQRVPMIPIPGMPRVKSPEREHLEPEYQELAVEKEGSVPHPITQGRDPEEVLDVEDVAPAPVHRTSTGDRGLPPPIPTEWRPAPPALPSSDRPAPPPVSSASRPAPPPAPIRSPSPGSEAEDELTEAPAVTSPITPSQHHQSKRTSYLDSDDHSHDSERRIPPIPLASPTLPPAHHSRAPPPLPPTAAPPSRQLTMDNISKHRAEGEGETEYEGDYDTDIAPGASHKDAVKAHAREPSMDESTTADDTPPAVRSPPVPPFSPPVPRAVPPIPPTQPPPPSRVSMDAPRAAPPPPPIAPPSREEDEEDYDPYRYASPPRGVPPPPRAMPPQSPPPPPQNRPQSMLPPLVPPPMPQQLANESSDDDDLYSSPPPRKSHDRQPPPPPQAPPHQHRPPPPPQDKPVPPPPSSETTLPSRPIGRKSLDVTRAMYQPRASMDQPRPSQSQEFIASDIDLAASSHWWTQANMLPPSLQGRKDILVEVQESRDGNEVEKVVHILYMDYSQSIVVARFDAHNVSDVELEQRHEPPPSRRQDFLERAYETYGVRIAKDVESKQNTVVGDGTPNGLIHELLRSYPGALKPISTRAFGALVYANLANASTQQYDEIRPGDIITFRNAKFQGKHGAMHAKYSVDVGKPDHVGVVVEWDGTKKKVRAWEQGRESKKVKVESFKMGDLRSGEVRVWRVMGKEWVGWNH